MESTGFLLYSGGEKAIDIAFREGHLDIVELLRGGDVQEVENITHVFIAITGGFREFGELDGLLNPCEPRIIDPNNADDVAESRAIAEIVKGVETEFSGFAKSHEHLKTVMYYGDVCEEVKSSAIQVIKETILSKTDNRQIGKVIL